MRWHWCPRAVTTVTSTVPSVPAGVVAVIEVSLVTLKVVEGLFVPKLTADASVVLCRLIVTGLPPVLGPDAGLTPLTVGAGGTV